MTKVIYSVFAHPDDEAFGPSGTLIKEVANGSQIHLISLTLGQAGANPENVEDLANQRKAEWLEAGNIIGASSQDYLGYQDGQLNNNQMIEIGQKIYNIAVTKLASLGPDDSLEFITFDLNGLSGHIDHIVASRATAWAFYRLKSTDSRVSKLRLYCLTSKQQPDVSTEWLFMEPGRNLEQIDQTIDASQYREQIVAAMMCHQTQIKDLKRHLETRKDSLGIDYFTVLQ